MRRQRSMRLLVSLCIVTLVIVSSCAHESGMPADDHALSADALSEETGLKLSPDEVCMVVSEPPVFPSVRFWLAVTCQHGGSYFGRRVGDRSWLVAIDSLRRTYVLNSAKEDELVRFLQDHPIDLSDIDQARIHVRDFVVSVKLFPRSRLEFFDSIDQYTARQAVLRLDPIKCSHHPDIPSELARIQRAVGDTCCVESAISQPANYRLAGLAWGYGSGDLYRYDVTVSNTGQLLNSQVVPIAEAVGYYESVKI